MYKLTKFLLVLIAYITVVVSSAICTKSQTTDSAQLDAERLWEAMIAARGGRDRLHAISNVQMSHHEKHRRGLQRLESNYEGIFVFPGKSWEWDDQKGTVFGMSIRLHNFETNSHISYVDAGRGARVVPMINPSQRNLVQLQLHLFAETLWVKPVPQRTRLAKLDNVDVDVVEVRVDELPQESQKVEFWLDRTTHLPLQVVYFSTRDGRELSGGIRLSRYVEIDGIKMPEQIGRMRSTYRLNVDYDPRVFERPPHISAGMEAWKKKG